MSEDPLDTAEPSDPPRPVLIVVASLALIALAAELFVGIVSASAPAIAPQVADTPQPSQQTAAPSQPLPAPTLPVPQPAG